MKDIQMIERTVLDIFKTITVKSGDSKNQNLKVLYASEDKLQQSYDLSKGPQLPIMGLITNSVGPRWLCMQGVLQTYYHRDLTEIIEQIYQKIGEHDHIEIEEISISHGNVVWASQSLLTGRFLLHYSQPDS